MGMVTCEYTLTFNWVNPDEHTNADLGAAVRGRFKLELENLTLLTPNDNSGGDNHIYKYLMARANTIFSSFGHNFHFISYKEHDGSFDVTFALLVISSISNAFITYGSIRQSIDYYTKDLKLLRKTFPSSQLPVNMRIKRQLRRPSIATPLVIGVSTLGFTLLFSAFIWLSSQDSTRIADSLDALGKRLEHSIKSLEKSQEALQTQIANNSMREQTRFEGIAARLNDLSVRPYNIFVPNSGWQNPNPVGSDMAQDKRKR
jgi:hypothetical protein